MVSIGLSPTCSPPFLLFIANGASYWENPTAYQRAREPKSGEWIRETKILSTCTKHISKCLSAAAFMTLLRPDYLFLLPPSTHFSFHLLHKTLLIPPHKTLASQDPPCRKCVINTFLSFLLSVNQFLDD